MKSYHEIRLINYKHRKDEKEEFFINIDDWIKSPYSSLKARYYIEVSSIIVYFLQFTKITPNQISIIYALLGIFGGMMLSLNNNVLIYFGLILFVLKGVVDWSDGLLARVTSQTSNIGHIIDTWGSHVGYHSLIFGIGMICYHSQGHSIYIFLVSVIFFISLIDFKLFGYHQLFYEILNGKKLLKENDSKQVKKEKYNERNFLRNLKFLFSNFLDERSRTLDFICLVVFIEIFNNSIYFTKIILILFLIKKLVSFLGNFFEIIILKKLKDKI